MKLKLLFFGALSESLGSRSETLTLESPAANLQDVTANLATRGAAWSALSEQLAQGQIKTAVNQCLVKSDAPVNDGDEVAFFPPVTGG